MDRKKYLNKIISEFENWWTNAPHSLNMDFYNDIISFTHLDSLNDSEFVDLFYDFVSKGGRVQSGGDRSKNNFQKTVLADLDRFKQFAIEPFEDSFLLKD